MVISIREAFTASLICFATGRLCVPDQQKCVTKRSRDAWLSEYPVTEKRYKYLKYNKNAFKEMRVP